ncbi:hypothetical protein D9M69_407050 [compost metagenome]
MLTQTTSRTPGNWSSWLASFGHRSLPGVGARVTTSLALAARSSSPICAASSSGLMAMTMPAASPPQMVKWVSGRFGSRKATTSFGPMPRVWKALAARVMSANSSA